ncbi:MFS general substrate transporter [Auriculariales sp. MPI-PUGE-AT-0066]|nr:MFS general substrate transporter [Auriculariales sp. MPI-PUGE-AT-0066]
MSAQTLTLERTASPVSRSADDKATKDSNSFAQTPALSRVSTTPAPAAAIADPELLLPPKASLGVILINNLLQQISFFIIVSSSNEYAKELGGTSTFSGVVIGIPTVISGITLLPLMRYDGGGYKLPLHLSCGASIVGHILYALAYPTRQLYLILAGRMVSGVAFSMFMYHKRYCADPRIVGIRRRTTLASLLVLGQALGMTLGPLFGGLLFKVGFGNKWFNGLTSPGWVMAGIWAVYWVFTKLLFEDPPPVQPQPSSTELTPIAVTAGDTSTHLSSLYHRTHPSQPEGLVSEAAIEEQAPVATPSDERMSLARWLVAALMCWSAMTCFFVLGAWEANIPVFTSSALPDVSLAFSPTGAGNFMAIGGAIATPLLLANAFLARRMQDRHILLTGFCIGAVGLVIFTSLLGSNIKIGYAPLLVCWTAVALGFNVASTVSMSLMSKTLPPGLNGRTSLAVQYSNYCGRVCGAVWGGSGVAVGMLGYIGLELGIVGVLGVGSCALWRDMKAKTG